MNEKISGLSIKLIISVLLLSVLLCTAISYMGYKQFTMVLEDEYNRSAYETAETAKTYLDPDRLEYYLETGRLTRPIWKFKPSWTLWCSLPTAISSM